MRVITLNLLAIAATCLLGGHVSAAETRPNIVLVIGEDMGPDTGSYGCKDAITPNIDRLAKEGAIFTRAFTHTGVCAPSRSGMVSGIYPLTWGGQNMRSKVLNPPHPFTEKLRTAGYTVLWPGKTDFQGISEKQLADSRELWVNYANKPATKSVPPKQPFFAYINDTVSHESQVRANDATHARNTSALQPSDRRDPAKVELPPFYPDTPEVRREVAHYHELVTAVDYTLGRVLAWLKEHHLEENTIVIFTGDHGRGMPRYKRSVKDTGTQVPLIVRWPGKIAPGTMREDFASWIDFAPTALSLAGVEIPKEYDGHVFLPTAPAVATKYVFSFRDFMDESYDKVRSVRDARYRYVRNLAPGVDEAGKNAYQEVGDTMKALRTGQKAGTLNATQLNYFNPNRPSEELFDTQADPWEVKNLAADPAHADKLAELRAACDGFIARCNPNGDLHADELVKRGIIAPRDEKYELRVKNGDTSGDAAAAAAQKAKKKNTK